MDRIIRFVMSMAFPILNKISLSMVSPRKISRSKRSTNKKIPADILFTICTRTMGNILPFLADTHVHPIPVLMNPFLTNPSCFTQPHSPLSRVV